MKYSLFDVKIGVIGLGYVGLPLAVEFGKKYQTVGFDINASRIKVRQFSDQNDIKNRYGNYSNTWDEFLQAIQVTFSGITKPQSMFQPLEEVKYNSNYMLQTWIHTNQMK